MDRVGPDIICSMDEENLKSLISGVNEIALMRGGKKEALKEEQVTIDFAFATIVSTRDIKKGEMLTRDNIWARRPGTGEIRAEKYEELLGYKAVVDIPADTHLDYSMLEK
jgi:sialic acid synthase SpsE